MLGHTGRKSGTSYTTPLLYLRDGDDVVVVASQGGMPKNPQWYRNLVDSPDTWIQIGNDRSNVRAHTASADERARLWPQLAQLYADFANYQSWTERVIPVVVLEPRGAVAS